MNTPWPAKKLECLVDSIRPITYGVVKPGDHDDNGVTFVRGGDIFQGRIAINNLRTITADVSAKYRRTLLQGGELLISLVGNPGEVAIAPPSLAGANIARQVGLIALVGSVDAKYVMYFLMSPLGKAGLGAQMKGSVQIVINLADLRNIQIPLPPITTQNRIASILSAYDDLIENNTRRIQILEEMAQRIYKEWFVDFRFPGHEKVKFVDSELGRIPSGWEAAMVGEVSNIIRGRSYRSSDLSDSGLPFINLKCIDRDGGFRKSGLKGYSGDYKENHRVFHGNIVIAVTDMTQDRRIVARAAIIPSLRSAYGIMSMDLVKAAPKDDICSNYLYSLFRWSNFSDEVKEFANGVNVLHLNPTHILKHRFVLPPLAMRNKYSAFVTPALKLIDNIQIRNEILRLTRDLLLPKLISGEIDVSEMPEPKETAAA